MTDCASFRPFSTRGLLPLRMTSSGCDVCALLRAEFWLCSSVGELLRGGNGGGIDVMPVVGVILRRINRGLERGDIIGLADV